MTDLPPAGVDDSMRAKDGQRGRGEKVFCSDRSHHRSRHTRPFSALSCLGGDEPCRLPLFVRFELMNSRMNLDALYSELTLKTEAKVALLVMDGLGDVATREQGFVTP